MIMAEEALRFVSVTKHFHSGGRLVSALEDVSFSIKPGQVTGLIGPDGAGKTTLMRLAASLLQPDKGEIRIMGLNRANQTLPSQPIIGYMPQRFGLYEDLSVQENLNLYADLQGVIAEKRPSRYQQLMQMTGLAPFIDRLAGKLSGGMKQKLGLACALLRVPDLLLLDEPTVGVDPVSRRELWQIIYRQVKDEGMSVLLSTAYLDEAERCDDVILLHQGQLLGQSKPSEFSRTVQGRTYAVSAAGFSPRHLQPRLSHAPNVLDALVEGEKVRLVMATEQLPTAEQLLPGQTGLVISPVTPRFEDAFIARLKRRSDDHKAAPKMELNISESESDEVIRVHDLIRLFGDFIAVNRVSFTVRRGEIFGLLGANGAGKSTTFRMLCGLLPVSGGEVAVAGHDLSQSGPDARRHIGYMAQKFSLYDDLSVTQNLRFFSSAYGLKGVQQRERIAWAMETFELTPYSDTNASQLPLGYKQRIAFAAALMHEPEILFLDEPTSGVDPLARREFWARTNALASAGVTILVTTHFMEEANYCDRLVIMADGEVLAEGTPHEIKAMARTGLHSDPSMEDAFIHLIEQRHHEESVT